MQPDFSTLQPVNSQPDFSTLKPVTTATTPVAKPDSFASLAINAGKLAFSSVASALPGGDSIVHAGQALEANGGTATNDLLNAPSEIASSFGNGVNEVTSGVKSLLSSENPIQGTEAGFQTLAGGSDALAAPIAPIAKVVGDLTGISPAIDQAENAVSDMPAVQQFARSPAGQATSRIAQDTVNASKVLGAVAGSPEAPKVATAAASGAKDTFSDLATKASDTTGKVLETTGTKIQNSVLKPSMANMEDGFKIGNVTKYDVGGSLQDTVVKSGQKLADLTQQLGNTLKSSDSQVDINAAYEKTANSLLGNKAASFGNNDGISRVLDHLKSEVQTATDGSGKANLVDATNIKRGAGTKGAWSYNRPEPDATAVEKVYTTFYSNLKSAIEQQAPPGIKDINRQISDLIPIQNAALRRMTVAERNDALTLGDKLGLFASVAHPTALAVSGAVRLSKSGAFGNFLTKAGQALRGTTSP